MFKQLHPILLILCFGFSFCKQPEKKEKAPEEKKEKTTNNYSTPPGYDLNQPAILHLKQELDEISGLAFYPKDTSVFAICDDKGWLYKIHLTGKMQVEKWKFSKGADFEDITLIDSTFYTLASNGDITAFKFSANQPSTSNTYSLHIDGVNEFETLYPDSATGKLVAICKDCATDSKKTVTAYSFDPSAKSFSDTPFYKLNASEVAEKLGFVKVKFKPSAAAINPLTNELYILSSVNKALVIADRNGTVKSAYLLNPKIYKQPEGITFTPSGDLVISNEGADIGAANILIFKLKK